MMQWTETSEYLYGTRGGRLEQLQADRVAVFDLDYTIIRPRSGKKFPEDSSDWEFMFQNTKKILRRFVRDGNTVAIITNQSTKQIDEFKEKIEAIGKKLSIPFVIFVATQNNLYRKPIPGFWNKFFRSDYAECFFCGDAAGRPADCPAGRPIDFSAVDLKFARNIGIDFIFPETIFEKDEMVVFRDPFAGVQYPPTNGSGYEFTRPDHPEMILMIGFPGSGKTHYVRNNILPTGYQHVNQDQLKTKAKCLKKCEEYLALKKSVVVDNTNLTKRQREAYTAIAKKYNTEYRYFYIDTSVLHCKHNMLYRSYVTNGVVPVIPDVVYRMMEKKLELPDQNLVRISLKFETTDKRYGLFFF